MDSKEKLKASAQAISEYLTNVFPASDMISEAMRYSLLAGGKHLRGVLLLEFAALNGVSVKSAMPFAAALEMIHTYSLIHDDLPCMDDDDFRRGKPSNHKVFGEAMAMLAGDGLLTAAFETMLLADNEISANKRLTAAGIIARSAGYSGMVGGQSDDVVNIDGRTLTLEQLTSIELRKTGALFIAACKAGTALGSTDRKLLDAAESYGRALGLAFQIRDDILDLTSNIDVLGKAPNSDVKCGKTTFVSLMGIEKSEEEISRLTFEAVRALNVFGKPMFLVDLANDLSTRLT